jgi:hypothetical protein
MKKRIAAALLASAAASASTAMAAPQGTFTDTFSYPIGSLIGNTNPTSPSMENGFSGTNVWSVGGFLPAPVNVVSGGLSVAGYGDNSNTMAQLRNGNGSGYGLDLARVGIGEWQEGPTIYYSMLLQVPDGISSYGGTSSNAAATSSGSFLAGLQFEPSNASGQDMFGNLQSSAAALTIRRVGTATVGGVLGDGFELGIGYRDLDNATYHREFMPDVLTAGSTHFVVVKFERGTGLQDDVANLYVDPDPALGEPAVATLVSDHSQDTGTGYDYGYSQSGSLLAADNNTIRTVQIRSNTLEPSNINVDYLRVGGSWDAVVPEPASVSLLAIGALGLARRKRRR